jgi:DNA-binding protein H-NS
LREKFKAEAAEAGLSLDVLFPSAASSGAAKRARKDGEGPKRPVKYRGPDGQEWSGVGWVPTWMAELKKQGRKREEFKA